MRRILFYVVFIIVALIGVNVYLIGTARADEISRYLKEAPATSQWADYIYQNQSGRHRITKDTARRIAKAVVIASSNYNIAPDVIVGLMKTESGFDPQTRSPSEALGLMQVVPYWHRKIIAGRNLFHIEEAVDIGVAILAQYQKQSKGSLSGALRRYCGYRPKAATLYVAKVMREHHRALKSVRIASASALPTPFVSQTVPAYQTVLAKLPSKDPLALSPLVEQKLARLGMFDSLGDSVPHPDDQSLPMQAKVYLRDPYADLSILPVKSKTSIPAQRLWNFGDMLGFRWS